MDSQIACSCRIAKSHDHLFLLLLKLQSEITDLLQVQYMFQILLFDKHNIFLPTPSLSFHCFFLRSLPMPKFYLNLSLTFELSVQ